MKKLILTLIAAILLLNTSIGQISKEVLPLVNSLAGLWYSGEIDSAVINSVKLYDLYPPMFIERVQNSLAQMLQRDSKHYGQQYLEELFKRGNMEITTIITPLYLWSKALILTDENELRQVIQDLRIANDTSDHYKSRLERYSLLILKELENGNVIDLDLKKRILMDNISNLEKYPLINDPASNSLEAEKRAWHRFILSNSYNYLFDMDPSKEDFLRKASQYSPDIDDKANFSAYFYDAILLTGSADKIGFQKKFYNYLIKKNQNEEALEVMSDMTFGNPTDENVTLLKNHYTKLNRKASFNEYWLKFYNRKGKAVPTLKFSYENDELELGSLQDRWIYIDVWGTWCSPCKEELPDLQTYYVENKDNEKLGIYTFSYGSQNLQEFMESNGYTFPVCEIDNEVVKKFEISGYPTKIIISPDGKYVKIPFGQDWEMYIRNYTLQEN